MHARIVVLFSAILVSAILVPWIPGCAAPESAAPETHGVRLTETHTIGESVVVGNLTVWPVFTDHPVDLGEFATLGEAMKAGTAEVREVGGSPGGTQQVVHIEDFDVEIASAAQIGDPINRAQSLDGNPMGNDAPQQNDQNRGGGATVGTLVIVNRGDLPLLVCAGTIVKGGNQDRQIGEDIIIQANATVPVQAFCVEQGRWAGNRLGAVTDGRFEVASMNATKGVREKGQYLKQQGEVWDQVAQTKEQLRHVFGSIEHAAVARTENARAMESTTSLAVVLDANREVAGKELAALCEAVRKHFAERGVGAVGFAYAVDGRVVSVRAFLNQDVFGRQFDPFLQSMVAEAWIARQGKDPDATGAPIAGKTEDVVALVAAIGDAEETTSKTRGDNLNGLRMNDRGYNGNCYLPVEGRKVAVTRDWSAK